MHPLPTPSQVEDKFVLDTQNTLLNPINNARLINELFCGLDANGLKQTDRAAVIWENVPYLSQFGDHVLATAVAVYAIELLDIGVDGPHFLNGAYS